MPHGLGLWALSLCLLALIASSSSAAGIAVFFLTAGLAWGQFPNTRTTFNVVGTTLRITGGRMNNIGGNAIYNFPQAEVEIVNGQRVEHRVFYLFDFNAAQAGNIPGPGCFWSTDFPIGNYIECPADNVRTIKVSLGPNPRNDLAFKPGIDPVTGQHFQYPAVTSIQIKSSGDTNELELGLVDSPSAPPMFPNKTNVQIKTKHPFLGR